MLWRGLVFAFWRGFLAQSLSRDWALHLKEKKVEEGTCPGEKIVYRLKSPDPGIPGKGLKLPIQGRGFLSIFGVFAVNCEMGPGKPES